MTKKILKSLSLIKIVVYLYHQTKQIIMRALKNTKGRLEEKHKQDVNSDVQQALDLISKGFYLVENNTALQHKEGGYVRISKRVSNYILKNI